MEQENSPETTPCTYGQLIYDKGVNNIKRGKHSIFNNRYWGNWTTTCKRVKMDLNLHQKSTHNRLNT